MDGSKAREQTANKDATMRQLNQRLGLADDEDWYFAYDDGDNRLEELLDRDDVCQKIASGYVEVESTNKSLAPLNEPDAGTLRSVYREFKTSGGYHVKDTSAFTRWEDVQAYGRRGYAEVVTVMLPSREEMKRQEAAQQQDADRTQTTEDANPAPS